MSLKNVGAFYERLSSDSEFRNKIEQIQSKNECSQFVKSSGYHFTRLEFEQYTSQILGVDSTDSQIQSLEEKELASILGGFSNMLIYGSVEIPE
jgi:predicted ribosomally synthesized peptide with nif11-like leader